MHLNIRRTGLHHSAYRSRPVLASFIAVAALMTTTAEPSQGAPYWGSSLRPVTDPVYGVTVDAIDHVSNIVTSLKSLAHGPTTRIVFDEFVPATQYVNAVKRIYPVSYIMGELLDSAYVKGYSVDQYKARTTEYLDALGPKVDIWEIGNEINGEWLGSTASVVNKLSAAYELVKQRGGRTALTLYYNQDCWEDASHEMFTWGHKNVPDYMRQGLDYVLVSYYEDDCNGLRPDWPAVFKRLGAMFPNSKLGFGEVGTTRKAAKAEFINRYYTMSIDHPNYIGGYFWWYFKQDMVPKTKYLWSVLNNAIQ